MHLLLERLAQKIEDSGPQYMAFGIFGLVNYPSFFLFWKHLSPQPYTSLTLRLMACALCFPLVFHNQWPQKIKSYLPLYWLLTLLFCLPFFGTYMFLKNHASPMWLMNIMLVIFLLILLVDWIVFSILMTIGMLLGSFFYYLMSDDAAFSYLLDKDIFSALSTYLWAIAIGIFFSHNTEKNLENKYLKEQLNTARLISSSIAHELRTPLNSIRFGLNGLEKYLPKLFEAYDIAKNHDLELPVIRKHHYDVLLGLTETIHREIYESNTIINMLLVNVNPNAIDSEKIETCDALECIEIALKRYPFNSEQEYELIKVDTKNNFMFSGVQQYVIHVLFNLLKNAIYHIHAERRGNIFIWLDHDEYFNALHFKDTSKGISNEEKRMLFKEFYSSNPNGTGVGLAFCKMAMHKMGGQIHCESLSGAYTEFVLKFPKLSST